MIQILTENEQVVVILIKEAQTDLLKAIATGVIETKEIINHGKLGKHYRILNDKGWGFSITNNGPYVIQISLLKNMIIKCYN